eukprot:TRINITY_DN6717_c0_g1_i1.p1 TRINITY_DN6717_c0_g1~~TRINITY_DN6717_c0_g1_i1.p1  ORF type:complete len:370 (-),score=21.08 TRINITY_DN6717_c0_g1_i1:307-1416(-)
MLSILNLSLLSCILALQVFAVHLPQLSCNFTVPTTSYLDSNNSAKDLTNNSRIGSMGGSEDPVHKIIYLLGKKAFDQFKNQKGLFPCTQSSTMQQNSSLFSDILEGFKLEGIDFATISSTNNQTVFNLEFKLRISHLGPILFLVDITAQIDAVSLEMVTLDVCIDENDDINININNNINNNTKQPLCTYTNSCTADNVLMFISPQFEALAYLQLGKFFSDVGNCLTLNTLFCQMICRKENNEVDQIQIQFVSNQQEFQYQIAPDYYYLSHYDIGYASQGFMGYIDSAFDQFNLNQRINDTSNDCLQNNTCVDNNVGQQGQERLQQINIFSNSSIDDLEEDVDVLQNDEVINEPTKEIEIREQAFISKGD